LLLQLLLRTHTVVPTTAALLLHHTAHRSSPLQAQLLFKAGVTFVKCSEIET